MKVLDEAIYAAYAASTLATTPLVTALYNTEAADDAVFPYIVFQLINGNTTEGATGPTFTEDMLLQFNIFSKNPALSNEAGPPIVYGSWVIEAALKLCYDFAALIVGGYDTLSCVRESTMQTRDKKVWQVNVTYRIKLRKT